MNSTSIAHTTIVAQSRMWQNFARILDDTLRTHGSRLWVKPMLHARYGLRQSRTLKSRTFILTTRLEGGDEATLLTVLQRERRPYEELHTRPAKDDRLALYTADGSKLGTLCRPAWSWIGPLVEIGYTPKFFLHEIAVHQGEIKAHVVVSHFHEGIEMYLMEHYRQQIEAVLA